MAPSTTNGTVKGTNGAHPQPTSNVGTPSHHASHPLKEVTSADDIEALMDIVTLNINSVPDDTPPPSPITVHSPDTLKNPQHAICADHANYTPSSQVHFTTDIPGQMGHYISIGFPNETANNDITLLYKNCGWIERVLGSAANVALTKENSKFMHIVYCFDDIRDAEQAYHDVMGVDANCKFSHITQAEYANAVQHQDTSMSTSLFDGQVIFVASYAGEQRAKSENGLLEAVRNYADHYGAVLTMADAVKGDTAHQLHFRVEFCKISAAKHVVANLQEIVPVSVKDWSVYAKEICTSTALVVSTPHHPKNDVTGYQISPTSRTAWMVGDDGKCVVGPPPFVVSNQASMRANMPSSVAQQQILAGTGMPSTYLSTPHLQSQRQPYPSSFHAQRYSYSQSDDFNGYHGTNQAIIPERIVSEDEQRTTLMLRNLPNEITAEYLKDRILDVPSRGKYNFSYLRFDFTKNLNVGYAFVDFESPQALLEFYDHWKDAPWCPGLKLPGKIRMAEMAFATIQGEEACMDKFRNSAVLLEAPLYRPKLWYSSRSAPDKSLIGKEKAFLPPNNLMKLQRSRDNAATIGMFRPDRFNGNGVSGFRQRPYRGNFDRGTLHQINEEAAMNRHDQIMAAEGMQMNHPYGSGMVVVPQHHVMPVQQPQHHIPNAFGPYQTFGYQPQAGYQQQPYVQTVTYHNNFPGAVQDPALGYGQPRPSAGPSDWYARGGQRRDYSNGGGHYGHHQGR